MAWFLPRVAHNLWTQAAFNPPLEINRWLDRAGLRNSPFTIFKALPSALPGVGASGLSFLWLPLLAPREKGRGGIERRILVQSPPMLISSSVGDARC